MIVPLTLFIISLVGISAMLFLKARMISKGGTSSLGGMFLRFDSFIEESIEYIYTTFEKLNHISFGALLTRTMRMITLSSRVLYKTAIQSENKILNVIKGKRTLERNGRRSDFLGSIEEHKRDVVYSEDSEENENNNTTSS